MRVPMSSGRRPDNGEDVEARVERFRSRDDEVTAPIGAIGTAPSLRGLEAPRDVADAIEPVDRAFAFLDLCGFTAFIATHGEHAAIDAINRFRSLTRDTHGAARRARREVAR